VFIYSGTLDEDVFHLPYEQTHLKTKILSRYASSHPTKSILIRSSGRPLSIDFFSDEEIQQILHEISRKNVADKSRSEKHRRYFLLVEFLFRTCERID
jgi:hypothetical protein